MKEKKKKNKGIFLYSGPLRVHRLDSSTSSYRYRYRRSLLLLMKHTSLSFIPLFFYALVVYDIGLQSWWHRRPLKAKTDCPASSDQVLSLYKNDPLFLPRPLVSLSHHHHHHCCCCCVYMCGCIYTTPNSTHI